MGLWFLTALFVSFFTTAAFMFASDRINPYEDPLTIGGQLLEKCHLAAIAQAELNADVGASGAVSFGCDDFPTSGTTNDLSRTFHADGGTVSIIPGGDIGTTGRVIVTYLAPAETLNGFTFERVQAQLAKVTMSDPNVGIVTDGAPYKAITPLVDDSGAGSTVPNSIDSGVLALVATVNP